MKFSLTQSPRSRSLASRSLASRSLDLISGVILAMVSAAVGLGFGLEVSLGLGVSVATPPHPNISRKTPRPSLAFTPPQGKDAAPQSTASGGTRDRQSCTPGGEPLQLGVPQGRAELGRPQFSLHVPQDMVLGNPNHSLILALRDPRGNFYERVVLPWPTTTGWMPLIWPRERSLPPTDQPYQWFVVVGCDSSVGPDNPTFSGWFIPQNGTVTTLP